MARRGEEKEKTGPPLTTVFHESTAIDRAVYHPDRRTLDIWYAGGDRYSYFEVPIELYELLRSAPSAGEFVNHVIKPNFRFELESERRRFRPPED